MQNSCHSKQIGILGIYPNSNKSLDKLTIGQDFQNGYNAE